MDALKKKGRAKLRVWKLLFAGKSSGFCRKDETAVSWTLVSWLFMNKMSDLLTASTLRTAMCVAKASSGNLLATSVELVAEGGDPIASLALAQEIRFT